MDFKTAYNKCASLCAQREYCTGDIIKKLKNWEVSSDVISKVVLQLTEDKFVDDVRYAQFFVRDKAKFNRWGEQKIAWALRQKQMSNDIIKDALMTLDEKKLLETLSQLLKEKNRQIKEENPHKRKASLIRYATGRGFNFDQILKVIDGLDF